MTDLGSQPKVIEEMTFEPKPEERKGARSSNILMKNIPGRGQQG